MSNNLEIHVRYHCTTYYREISHLITFQGLQKSSKEGWGGYLLVFKQYQYDILSQSEGMLLFGFQERAAMSSSIEQVLA